jgi:hypothetical protein
MTEVIMDANGIINELQDNFPFPCEVVAGEREVGIDCTWIVIQLPNGDQYLIKCEEVDDENRIPLEVNDPS